MPHKDFDIAVIGAGVIGAAIARECAIRHPRWRIAALEKLSKPGLEASAHNSGILHSGIHENPRFLKARLARSGTLLACSFANEHDVPTIRRGMLIALPRTSRVDFFSLEWRSFLRLVRNGIRRRIPFRFCSSGGVHRLEPRISALGGIFLPDVAVIDARKFVAALYNDARSRGAQFFFDSEVREVIAVSRGYLLRTGDIMFRASAVVNAAGIYADEIARMAGFDGYKIFPWRGEYYEVIGAKRNIVSRPVYPVMPSGYPGKGIHFGPRPDGRLFIGPNAIPIHRKDFRDEQKTPVAEFLRVARSLCPEIVAEDLQWAYAGIRAKQSSHADEADFCIRRDCDSPPWMNAIGIDSPGLSAAMGVAEYAVSLLDEVL
jgi:L-2-hydroxyglutarate oxidase LhgO